MRYVLSIVCLAASWSLVTPVHAQDSGDAEAGADERRRQDEARARFEAGRALVDLELYTEAHGEFQRGFEISQRAAFLFNMAECSRRAGDIDEARREYAEYLRRDPSGPLAEQARLKLEALGPGDRGTPRFLRNDAPPSEDPNAVGDGGDSTEEVVDLGPVEGESTGTGEQTEDGARPRRWYRHWALWTGVALVVGGAVLTGVVLTRDGPGLRCQTSSCAIIE
ncbi:MAG: tetratricopeptide repeat protein [Myxococcota bacterium]